MKITLVILGAFAAALGFVVLWAGSAEQPEAWDPPPSPAPLEATPGDFTLEVHPKRAMIDQPVRIAVRDAQPGETVVLRMWTEDANGQRFESWARFVAEGDGSVDTATMRPEEGTYRSVDASGLLWSMRTSDASSYEFPSDAVETRVRLSAETTRGVVETSLTRVTPVSKVVSETVSTELVDAQLWLPTSRAAPLPAVIRLHGSEGAFNPLKSALLASAGFAVLDLRYVDPKGIPEIVAVPVEVVSRGIDWLARDPRVDAARIGVYGASKGAELALYAAAKDPRIRAVVAWSPSSVAFEGISVGTLSPGSSWSWQGQPTAYAPYRMEGLLLLRHVVRLIFGKVSLLSIYEPALAKAPAAAGIPVEQIAGAILLLAGEDDRMWPAAKMVVAIDERLDRNDHASHEKILYENTGHRMRYALWPDRGEPSKFVGGGNPEANHKAGRDAWQRIKDFFRRELKANSP